MYIIYKENLEVFQKYTFQALLAKSRKYPGVLDELRGI